MTAALAEYRVIQPESTHTEISLPLASAYRAEVHFSAERITALGGGARYVSIDRNREIIEKKRARLESLTDGWRGPGSLAPSAAARNLHAAAVEMLNPALLLDAEPAPTASGGLLMEWERAGLEYSAEITRSGDLVLNVFAEDEDDDLEKVIRTPSPLLLAYFIARGI